MKVTLNKEKLSKALQYASRSVSQKPNIPILSNALLDVTKTDLKIAATNLDMGIVMWIAGGVEKEGSVTVSAKYIADFVSAVAGDKVEMEVDGNNLNVKTTQSKASFNTIPSTEFPVLPAIFGDKLFSINRDEFEKSLESVLFAASTDLSVGKIQQSGVYFELDEKSKLNFIGLDGFRLSKRSAKIMDQSSDFPKEGLIIPARYLSDMLKIFGDYPELEVIDVYLSENKSQIIFKFEEVEFSIRLLEGPYPEYKKILPDSYAYSFEVEKSELERAIKIISTFARSNLAYKTLFDFDVENNKVTFRSNVAEIGENETSAAVENVEGASDLNTAYNLRYLQDVVNHIKGDRIRFETKGALAASVFKDMKDENFMHLLMPLRRE